MKSKMDDKLKYTHVHAATIQTRIVSRYLKRLSSPSAPFSACRKWDSLDWSTAHLDAWSPDIVDIGSINEQIWLQARLSCPIDVHRFYQYPEDNTDTRLFLQNMSKSETMSEWERGMGMGMNMIREYIQTI